MFDYIGKSAHGILISLGRYMKKELVWTTSENELIPCDDVNRWDRHAIALSFYNYWQSKGGELPDLNDEEIFLTELAVKIDELIPKHYFEAGVNCGEIEKRYHFEPEPKYYKRWQSPYTRELKFVYPSNEAKELQKKDYNPMFIPPTNKQLDYLIGLLKSHNLKLRTDAKITKADCELFINYFLGNVAMDRSIGLTMVDHLRPKHKQHDYSPIIKALDLFLEEGPEADFEIDINIDLLMELDDYGWVYEYIDVLTDLQILNFKNSKLLNENIPIFYVNCLNYNNHLGEFDEKYFNFIWYLFNEYDLIELVSFINTELGGYQFPAKYALISENSISEIKDSDDVIALNFKPLFSYKN